MKNLNILIIGILGATALISCNVGTSNTPSGGNTQYNLQNYKLTVGAQTNNCTLQDNSTLNCDSKGTFGGVYSVSFNTPNGKPGAYVVMPPSGDTYGLNIAATGSGCNQTVTTSGETYTCNFTIGVNGTAQAATTVPIEITGTLGNANIITINIQ
ncbi:MAG: hypothetical protein K2X04_12140 [Burkholderiales bacterium]|nr:hypothetical protein [Burkholderiales bacterium]